MVCVLFVENIAGIPVEFSQDFSGEDFDGLCFVFISPLSVFVDSEEERSPAVVRFDPGSPRSRTKVPAQERINVVMNVKVSVEDS